MHYAFRSWHLSGCNSGRLLLTWVAALLAVTVRALPGDTTKVSVSEGTNMAIALSPDKRLIAMDLQGVIWVLPVSGGKAVAITDNLGDCRQPSWSPDGNRVAFQSYRDGNYHIWTVNRDGTGRRQLTFGPCHDREPHWSPDGSAITFSSDRSGNYDIWKLVLESNSLVRVTQNAWNEYFPVFSGDGKQIAYVSENPYSAGIYVTGESGEQRLIVASKGKLASPVWHPGGMHLIFNSTTPGSSLLEMVRIGGGDWVTLTGDAEDVFPFKTCWLSDSEYLYTADGHIKRAKTGAGARQEVPFTADLEVVRNNYTTRKRSFDPSDVLPVKGIRSPAVSHDGKYVAFTALGDLWVLEIGKNVPSRLTDDAYADLDPVWSPDDNFLAYTSDRNGNMDIWVRDLKRGTDTCLIDRKENLKFPGWSPDGKKMAYYESDPKVYSRTVLNVTDLETMQTKTVYAGLFEASQPSWMPDSKKVAVSALEAYSTRFREGINKILVIGTDSISSKFVTPAPFRSLGTRGRNGPFVSPSGDKICYILDNALWVAGIDNELNITGEPVRLTEELAEAPGWAGNSGKIVFLATDRLKVIDLRTRKIEDIDLALTWKPKASDKEYVIRAGKVFDGRQPAYLENVYLTIGGNRIRDISAARPPGDREVIDMSGKTLVPGLFEMHTHQNAYLGEKGGRLWLAYGVTSVREPGTDPYDCLERSESWSSGRRLGPRIFFTGGHMEGNRLYYNRNTSNVGGAQLKRELDRGVALGYDMIKTYVGLSDSLQREVTAFAHRHGIPVSSHEIYPAAGFGVDAVEHIGATSRRGYSPKLTALNRSYDDVVRLLAASGMWMTPTLSLHGGLYNRITQDPGFFGHRQFAHYFGADQQARLTAAAEASKGLESQYRSLEEYVVKLVKSGVKLTPGTDSPIIPSGVSYHAELQSWVAAGISPFETLRAATIVAAEEIGVDQDLGSIEVGKVADIVIVDGDPLHQIKDLLKVEGVIRNGVYIPAGELLR